MCGRFTCSTLTEEWYLRLLIAVKSSMVCREWQRRCYTIGDRFVGWGNAKDRVRMLEALEHSGAVGAVLCYMTSSNFTFLLSLLEDSRLYMLKEEAGDCAEVTMCWSENGRLPVICREMPLSLMKTLGIWHLRGLTTHLIMVDQNVDILTWYEASDVYTGVCRPFWQESERFFENEASLFKKDTKQGLSRFERAWNLQIISVV